MQCLFEGSEEAPGVPGLGLVPGRVRRFQVEHLGLAVPEMGWNGVNVRKHSVIIEPGTKQRYYFVHSFIAVSDRTDFNMLSPRLVVPNNYQHTIIFFLYKFNTTSVVLNTELQHFLLVKTPCCDSRQQRPTRSGF